MFELSAVHHSPVEPCSASVHRHPAAPPATQRRGPASLAEVGGAPVIVTGQQAALMREMLGRGTAGQKVRPPVPERVRDTVAEEVWRAAVGRLLAVTRRYFDAPLPPIKDPEGRPGKRSVGDSARSARRTLRAVGNKVGRAHASSSASVPACNNDR